MNNDEFLDAMSTRIQADLGAGISPAIIAIIIAIAKKLLEGCFQAGSDTVAIHKAGRLRVRILAMRELSNSGGSWFTTEGRQIVDAVVKLHTHSTVEEIAMLRAV